MFDVVIVVLYLKPEYLMKFFTFLWYEEMALVVVTLKFYGKLQGSLEILLIGRKVTIPV